MFNRTKVWASALALLTSLLVSLPIAQSPADAKEKQTDTSRTASASRSASRYPYASPMYNKKFAYYYGLSVYGWGDQQFPCLVTLWNHESGWRVNAHNRSGAHGIPQALPGSKMSSMGSNWQTSPETQIKWGLRYVSKRYHTPCGAWSFWQKHNWY
jgi:hypothetical protein